MQRRVARGRQEKSSCFCRGEAKQVPADTDADYLALSVVESVPLEISSEWPVHGGGGSCAGAARSQSGVFKVVGPTRQLGTLRRLLGADTAGDNNLTGCLSPPAQVSVPRQYRAANGIPAEAKSFCFIYPLTDDVQVRQKMQMQKGIDLARENWAFVLLQGGFAYFDAAQKLVQVNAITFAPSSEAGLLLVGHEVPEAMHVLLSMEEQNRLVKVNEPDMMALGFTAYGWVHGNEQFPATDGASNGGNSADGGQTRFITSAADRLDGKQLSYEHGAFLYRRSASSSTAAGGTEQAQDRVYMYALLTPKHPEYSAGFDQAMGDTDESRSSESDNNLLAAAYKHSIQRSMSAQAVQLELACDVVGVAPPPPPILTGTALASAEDNNGGADGLEPGLDSVKGRHALLELVEQDLLRLGCFVVYLAMGLLFYANVKHQHQHATPPAVGAEENERSWSYPEALYFSVATMSTVG